MAIARRSRRGGGDRGGGSCTTAATSVQFVSVQCAHLAYCLIDHRRLEIEAGAAALAPDLVPAEDQRLVVVEAALDVCRHMLEQQVEQGVANELVHVSCAFSRCVARSGFF